jgi:hypothetical protein
MPTLTGEVTTEVSIEFEAYCEVCGAGICHTITTGKTNRRGYPTITIIPCPSCIEDAKEAGRDEVREAQE